MEIFRFLLLIGPHAYTTGFQRPLTIFPRDIIDEEKEEVARSWLVDKPGYDIIVATTAFGMGIDKANV